MNFVFWTTLLALAVGAVIHWRAYKKRPEGAPHPTAEALPLPTGTEWPIPTKMWTIDNVEFLASPDRVRAVVSVTFPPNEPEDRRECLQLLSSAIYRHTEVQAVFVEVSGVGDEGELYLFAPDGRGW